jgi:hypothetical protein
LLCPHIRKKAKGGKEETVKEGGREREKERERERKRERERERERKRRERERERDKTVPIIYFKQSGYFSSVTITSQFFQQA